MTTALFFTYGMSARTWKEKGLLDREKLLYEKLLQKNAADKIYWFTYGADDKPIEGELNEGIEIIPAPKIFTSRIGIFIYSFFLPIIHRALINNVDILKTNQMYGSWTAVIARILFRKRLIVRTGYTWSIFAGKTNSSRIKKYIIKTIERFAYLFADAIAVSSANDLDYLKNHFTFKARPEIIPNYIDTNIFHPVSMQKKPDSLCFVGRLDKQKNLLALLEALTGLPYTLSIIGSGSQKEALAEYAKANNIKVDFHGNIPNHELPGVLCGHELFILPSFYEGLPKALLEAMSCGLPCIGTKVEGTREILLHKDNGYLCSPDPESIRSAIIEVFEDSLLRKNLGLNARATIEANFSIERVVEKEAKIYRECLTQ